MQLVSHFKRAQKNSEAYSSSSAAVVPDAGLPTRSGLIAGIDCKADFRACVDACEPDDLDCIRKCGQSCLPT